MAEETRKADPLGRPLRQDETDNLQKSVNPDGGYMRDRHLCPACHGVARDCGDRNCPQRRG